MLHVSPFTLEKGALMTSENCFELATNDKLVADNFNRKDSYTIEDESFRYVGCKVFYRYTSKGATTLKFRYLYKSVLDTTPTICDNMTS